MSLNFLADIDEFQALVRSVDQNEKGLCLSGLVESAKPFVLAHLLKYTQKKIIFIMPSSRSLTDFEVQCRFFLSQFKLDIPLNVLPALSDTPFREIPPSLEAISSRMRFFYALSHEKPRLLITNLFGLLKPFPHPDHIENMFLRVDRGEEIGRDRLIKVLEEYGYTREDITNSHGEYAWRGGIVDVFSPWESHPFRIEFSGDRVHSMRTFDTATQRSLSKATTFLIPSLREFPGTPQFLMEWIDKARALNADVLPKDLKEKASSIRRGEIFPSFVFQALLNRDFFVPFRDYFHDYLFVIDNSDEVSTDWDETFQSLEDQYTELREQNRLALPPKDIYSPELWNGITDEALVLADLEPHGAKKTTRFSFQPVTRFANKIPFFLDYLKKSREERERTYVYLANEGVRKKFAYLLSQHQIPHLETSNSFLIPKDGEIALLVGELRHGFRYPKEKVVFFSERDIFTEEKILVSRPRLKPFVTHFQDLKSGDHIVHTDYGVGIFTGLVKLDVDQKKREFIALLYKEDDKLFVPVEDLNLVQKYANLGTGAPVLNKLGTPNWERTKSRTKKVIESMAKELLHLYAQRKAASGHGYSQEGAWQSDFAKTFEYAETDDQLRAIKDLAVDMESEIPMDRLLCGDVGYGKTEVAMRASFKAVMDGKQVAVLCPTTVLASQHHHTFQSRMVLFPVRVESLTRFQPRSQQIKILEDTKKGLVDIVIGTHRLLSKDVLFKDLGLLIVDEEQRFGVSHKERIKQMKTNIDVLTMTATPIPRTLNMSLSGLRDISLIETAPKDRLAIHTVVTAFSRGLITSAIKAEMGRGGQVYVIHNRIEDIDSIAGMIQKWVPQARVVTVHGQMSSSELEKRMVDFIEQKYDVLVSTTIIENGIDIPLVNTLIVNRADRFGLAQLYQLRGRVGRSSRQAIAYFLVPPFTELTSLAKERLKALQEFSELGSGFRLAAKDLEIRGAGNFLGAEQHGYMEAVGFNYYMSLLEKTIKELKGEETEEVKSEINLKVDIRIPEDYLPQINLRLNLYKRVSSIDALEDIEKIREEMIDRYGPLPLSVETLLQYGVVKYLAQQIKVHTIDRIGRKIIIKFFPSSDADLVRMTQMLDLYDGSITPQGVMSLKLKVEGEAEIMNETILILKELSSL
ncbi:transcription-repair coupling factor [Acidobacteriota bacterium]